MDKFTFSYPTKVYFGEGSAAQALGAELSGTGETVMLAYGGGSIKKNGIYDEIRALLEKAGKKVVDFSGIMSNPTYKKAQEGAALVREQHVDFILAVGGGSVIDCCKVISAQAVLEEDIWDMEYKKGKFPAGGIRMGAVVTASGTGAEMNAGAVITYEEKKWKGPVFGTAASFAVLDPAYTMSVPQMQVLSGAFDTLSHAMETYLGTSDKDNVSDDVALAVMKNTVTNMRRLLKDSGDCQARSNLMWDSAMAENGILKCGRLTDFQAHQIEHQLGAYTDCNHGQGLAVIQPVYYRHIVKDAPEKFTRFAKVVFDADSAEAGLDALEAFIRECHLPTKMRELKSTVEITPEVLRQVADTCNIIKCNPRELDREEIYQILLECL
ncbi:alcohol dehydrogenase, iron-dependent [Marvinbryantia formatexigens DSM 14469]|uniref:Alcohol dehydrogenase, iron-dependent n=1 Tax=Marvinbryantia formatexigens DSM 14469 TaxID=478749 RepID=C6LM68_9FIRM|nr:iron-containing alcohol dehydrogenase [Marvinbryantia formatexigens]EET58283.1 alcohol dehydrogenase, iron-dependent [Marvinbryantia formatexigens DSM 14469]UWO23653.1 iron-containing alcohol dehydrogenase [Marvinbryantia formatexigens DSM 14469]SDF64637.1 Alcohol dehydrogenase YqhD, Fe-dependent ADH family [Marvinbryantia formatexigens]